MPRFNPSRRQMALIAIFLVMVVLTGLVVTANYATANGDHSIFLPIIQRAAPGTLSASADETP